MRRICTICARGGSKGVPGKNIRPLLGRPLIAWSIQQAKDSGLFELVAVSSDDPQIRQVAERHGADLVIERPAELATDTVSKIPAIVHAVEYAEGARGMRFDVVVELDATSPLRSLDDIRQAVDLLEREGRSCVITGAPARRSPYFNLVERDAAGRIALSKSRVPPPTRRQDVPEAFDMNASIYVWRRDVFLADPALFYPDTGLFVMPEERSHDIDSALDFEIVELLARKQFPQDRAGAYLSRHDLTGRVAAVTGAVGILGQHFCAALAEHGADVAVVDRSPEDCKAFARQLEERYPVRAVGVPTDLRDPVAICEMADMIEAALGPIDILHNNAATKGSDPAKFFAPPEKFEPDVWREIMAVNLDAMYFAIREIGCRMAERGRGSIIQTASIYGVVAPDQRIYEGSHYMGGKISTPAVYSASKAGVVGLTRFFAAYWGPHGVRVNTLTPGGVRSGQNEVFERSYSQRVPMNRMAEAEEMAAVLVFLASDASSYVTGHNLVVDGGLTVW